MSFLNYPRPAAPALILAGAGVVRRAGHRRDGDPVGRVHWEGAVSSGASLSVRGAAHTNAVSTPESNDEQRANPESSIGELTSSSRDLTLHQTEASDPEPADATRQLRARGAPLGTIAQSCKSAKTKAGKASQSTEVLKPAGKPNQPSRRPSQRHEGSREARAD